MQPASLSPQGQHARIGIVVGLVAEARIAALLGCEVAVGGGTAAGAAEAAQVLIARGVTALVSFGLAGGLDPALAAGTVLIPARVLVEGTVMQAAPALCSWLGGATPGLMLAGQHVVATVMDKQALRARTGAAAVDLESGAVATAATDAGLGFAMLRAICDPATRALPPAALAALDQHGAIGGLRVLASVARRPWQLPALLGLARDAATAHRALHRHVQARSQDRGDNGPAGG